MKIVAIENIGLTKDQLQTLATRFEDNKQQFISYTDRQESEDSLIQRIAEAEVLIVSNIKLTANVLQSAPNLKFISVAFTGCDHLPLDYCKEHGIMVSNAAGYSTRAVTELAIGLMIDLYRKITPFNVETRNMMGRRGFLGREISGKIVGVIGTGAIGFNVARVLQAFGCRVVAYSRSVKQDVVEHGITYLTLHELLKVSDIVSLHTPLTNETRHLIGETELALMKPSAILINTSRGDVVDQVALKNALESGTIGGAGLDVFDIEPPLPLNHPLIQAPNTVIVPHIGYATEEAIIDRAEIVYDNIIAYLNGQQINKVV